MANNVVALAVAAAPETPSEVRQELLRGVAKNTTIILASLNALRMMRWERKAKRGRQRLDRAK